MKKSNELAGRSILLVNTGSTKKKFIVQKLHRLGLKVIVLNKEKNWAEPYATHWILADTNNHSEAIQQIHTFLKDHPEVKLEGVLCFWEDDILLTSRIIDRYHLIGIPLAIAKNVRNKYRFREFCKAQGLPTPQAKLIHSKEELDYIAKHFTFPLVIKPAYGSSSAFVMKVENKEELVNTYNYIKNSISTNTESALSDGFDILAEEYIDGDEVDIDILLQNGKIKFWSIADNYQTNEPYFLETGYANPSNLPPDDKQALLSMAEETLEKFGIQNGCIHFEAKSSKKGPVPIEVNMRMGGDEIYPAVKEVWGVDLIENAAKIALGIYIPKIVHPDKPRRYMAAQSILPDHSGILVNLEIDENLEKNKNVEEFHFFKKIGDPVLAAPQGFDFLGWIAATGDNSIDAEDNLEDALKQIRYEIAKFDYASSIGKTTRKNQTSPSAINKDLIMRRGKIEKIRSMSIKNQRNLHVGIACNAFDETSGSVEQELSSVGYNIEKTLRERGYKLSFFDFNNLTKAFDDLKKSDVDVVFNVCERINGSSLLEPHAASILDTLQIPYTGSSPFTLSLCIDKIRIKKLLSYHGIPTPKWDYVYTMEDDIRTDFKYPLIVKPANSDNSIGITNDSVVTDAKQLKTQLQKIIFDFGRPALIEEYIEGDEYDVSIMGSEEEDLRILPLSRSVFDKLPAGYWHIFPFEAKFENAEIYKKGIEIQRPPKNISKKLSSVISEIALDTYNILDCHDYGRVEIRVDKNNNPFVLELNPNPSINIPDCVPSVARLLGMDYGDFLEEVLRMAIQRYKNNPPYYHLQPNLL
ncbi:MAG: ATP-grasp domain-containing protein [Candidatus Gracilibacteria bacterium]|nr:ATP-grasp domain-containing protein [Candidatus Gracilibacteria bacterium]